jgi:hypothetical protein
MTWKAFKEAVEKAGMKDETEVDFINWEGDTEPFIHLEPGWNTVT